MGSGPALTVAAATLLMAALNAADQEPGRVFTHVDADQLLPAPLRYSETGADSRHIAPDQAVAELIDTGNATGSPERWSPRWGGEHQ